jgi:branched-chain amino acid transport system permease protein
MIVQFIFNICLSLSLYLIVALSFSLIYYSTKFFHIAHASIITIGPYLLYSFWNQYDIHLSISIIMVIILLSFMGIIIDLLIYRPMRKKNVSLWAYLIASIGLLIVIQNLISIIYGDDAKVISSMNIAEGHKIFGAYITTVQIIIVSVSIVLFVTVNYFLLFTKTGKSIRAVSDNRELCNTYGINTNKIILICFGIGSALGGIAGILSALDTNMTPTFGFNLLLYGVIAMIIGGVGSTRGLLAGSFLVASAQHLGAYYIDTTWMDAIAYVILIAFLIWKPLGFSGMKLRKVEV